MVKMAEEPVTLSVFQTSEEDVHNDSPEIAKEVEEKLNESDITTADEAVTNTNKQEDEPASADLIETLELPPEEVVVELVLAGDPKNEFEDDVSMTNAESQGDGIALKQDNLVECEDVAKTEAPCDIRTEIGNKFRRRPVPFTRTARYRFARALKRRSIKL